MQGLGGWGEEFGLSEILRTGLIGATTGVRRYVRAYARVVSDGRGRWRFQTPVPERYYAITVREHGMVVNDGGKITSNLSVALAFGTFVFIYLRGAVRVGIPREAFSTKSGSNKLRECFLAVRQAYPVE